MRRPAATEEQVGGEIVAEEQGFTPMLKASQRSARVCYVCDTFPGATFVMNEIWGLLELGHEIGMVNRSAGPNPAETGTRGTKVLPRLFLPPSEGRTRLTVLAEALRRSGRVKAGRRPRAILEHVARSREVARLADRIAHTNADVYLCHFGFDHAVSAALAAKRTGKPLILWLHGSDVHQCPHRSLHWVASRCSTVVTNSQYMAALARGLGVTCEIHISRLGVDTELFGPAGPERKSNRPVVVAVARLGHCKNHRYLLEVFATLLRTHPEAELWLVGSGPDEQAIRSACKKARIESSVRFLGSVPRDELPGVLRQAWVKALFSELEGLGVAFMEALSCGIPCVASRVGGIPEVVDDGESGFLVDLGKPGSQEQAVAYLRRLIDDRALREKMGRAGRARATAEFGEEHHVRRMHQLIQRAAGRWSSLDGRPSAADSAEPVGAGAS